MPVFVHEFCCSGAFEGDLGGSSLVREGLAMLTAVVEDLSRCPAEDSRVVTTLDARLRGSPRTTRLTDHAKVAWAGSAPEERNLFRELAGVSHATFVIAPESNGRLLERRRMIDEVNGRFLGHSLEAIRLCGDKLSFHDHLRRHALPTIPTSLWDSSAKQIDCPFPIVVKPRDGAGSVDTFLIGDRNDLKTMRAELARRFADAGTDAIVQPYLAGRALSAAALIGSEPDRIEIFPFAEQRISRDGRFTYQGGQIPAPEISLELACEATQVIRTACRSLPGLAGFIGFDLIATGAAPRVRIVEANPRLTTSYVGYRRLTLENLAARMLFPDASREPIKWNIGVGWDKLALRAQAHHSGGFGKGGPSPPECVEFDADGEVRLLARSKQ
jgi:predicted ATP-grasp superfamily ATP-dependent carboligase